MRATNEASNKALSAEAEHWRKAILAEYELDSGGKMMLQAALEALDRCREAEKLLEAEGLTFVDKYGAKRPNPAATIARLERESMVRCLKSLGLDMEAIANGR